MGCIAKQFLNFCPRPLLVHDFCSRVLVPSNSFHKNQKKVCASDSHGRHEVQSLTKIQIFMVSGHDFYTTASIRRSKFAFSCISQPILSENEKRNASTLFLTHIFAFKVAISLSTQKRVKIRAPISLERVGILGKKFTRCQMSSFSIK